MQPSVPGGIPGRLIREMLQFGLETAEKLPAILYRKIFYYIITENILYLLGLCYLSDTPLDSKPSSIQGKGYLLKCRYYCEAQGKGRAKGRPRKVTQRSFLDGGWWMVDTLSLMLYIKFGCYHQPPSFHRTSHYIQD